MPDPKRKLPKVARRRNARHNAPHRPIKPSGLRDDRVTIQWLRDLMREFLRQRQWEKYHLPRNLAASISVEAGELLELFQWLTPEEAALRCSSDPAFRHAVGEELCDVLMYCISLANAMDFNIAQTIAAKMRKNHEKYPPEKFLGHYERPLRNLTMNSTEEYRP
jgi:NTP pyrophosphatase (non-canonical NTP hydrolase)